MAWNENERAFGFSQLICALGRETQHALLCGVFCNSGAPTTQQWHRATHARIKTATTSGTAQLSLCGENFASEFLKFISREQ
jgi:hypothetical protein